MNFLGCDDDDVGEVEANVDCKIIAKFSHFSATSPRVFRHGGGFRKIFPPFTGKIVSRSLTLVYSSVYICARNTEKRKNTATLIILRRYNMFVPVNALLLVIELTQP